jgi:hypothetical protein
MAATTLKGKNLTWLVAALAFDAIVLWLVASQAPATELASAQSLAKRAALVTLLPVPALLLSSLLSSNLKAVLVFWRWQHPLPGARAFTVHAPADPRIALDRLRKNVGEFPQDLREQNSRWYALYREVQDEASVRDSHGHYLLFRDLAAVSLLLMLAVPLALLAVASATGIVLGTAAFFLIQYLLAAQAGRVAGVRMVRNVLALHASLKPPARTRTTKTKE